MRAMLRVCEVEFVIVNPLSLLFKILVRLKYLTFEKVRGNKCEFLL